MTTAGVRYSIVAWFQGAATPEYWQQSDARYEAMLAAHPSVCNAHEWMAEALDWHHENQTASAAKLLQAINCTVHTGDSSSCSPPPGTHMQLHCAESKPLLLIILSLARDISLTVSWALLNGLRTLSGAELVDLVMRKASRAATRSENEAKYDAALSRLADGLASTMQAELPTTAF